MAGAAKRLSAIAVTRLTEPGMHHDGGGLYLQISSAAQGVARSWIYRFTIAGRTRYLGLGAFPGVSLATARKLAEEARALVVTGIDPVEQKRARRAALKAERAKSLTFKEAAEAYIDSHERGWRNPKHRQQWRSTLETYAYPLIGGVQVGSIGTAHVMRVLEPIWTKKPETAARVRGRIEAVLDSATAREFRMGPNPARLRGHLDKLLPKRSKVQRVEHHAAMDYNAVPGFMAELRQREDLSAKALEFTVLCATRTGETIGARWAEVDIDGALWTIPAVRTKTEVEHRIPLAPRAIEILRKLNETRHSAFVFPGTKPDRHLSNMALLMALRRMGHASLTVHGFRSSFRTWAAECTSSAREVCEQALGHAIDSKVEAAYRRGDLFRKRRNLMNAWAKFCAAPPKKAPRAVIGDRDEHTTL